MQHCAVKLLSTVLCIICTYKKKYCVICISVVQQEGDEVLGWLSTVRSSSYELL